MEEKKQQMSESIRLGCILAMVGGFLDVYTYIARGKVFANAQTGNIILLGLNIAKLNIEGVIQYFIPIAAFIAGVIVAEVIKEQYKYSSAIHWRQIIIILEMAVLAAAAWIPKGEMDLAVNVMISFVCSVQVQSFRKVHGSAIATTMCTGNLRSATEEMYHFIRSKSPKEKQRSFHHLIIIVFFIIGAVIGTVVTKYFSIHAVIFCDILLLAVFLLMFKKENL